MLSCPPLQTLVRKPQAKATVGGPYPSLPALAVELPMQIELLKVKQDAALLWYYDARFDEECDDRSKNYQPST